MVLYLKFSSNFIIGGDGTYEVGSAPMVDVSNYEFTYLADKTVKTEESFNNTYINKCLEF